MVVLQFLPQVIVSGLTMGSIYALMALGFHLVFATTRVLNFAYGTMVVLGGLFAYSLLTVAKLNVALALIVVLLGAVVVGYCFQRLAARPLASGSMGQQIMGLVVVASIVENTYALIWGKEVLPVPAFSGTQPLLIAGAALQPQVLWVIGVTLAAFALIGTMLHTTLLGRALRATASNPLGAKVVGIRHSRMIAYSYLITTVVAMLAGAVVSPIIFAGGFVAMELTVKGFTASVLGGLTSLTGALIGGLALGLIEASLAMAVSSGYREALVMGLLLVVLLTRPEGLLGKHH